MKWSQHKLKERASRPITLELETTPYGYALLLGALRTVRDKDPGVYADADVLVRDLQEQVGGNVETVVEELEQNIGTMMAEGETPTVKPEEDTDGD